MKIYNTFTKKIEEFKSIKEKEIKMYVCGPTVYNLIHIGNARPIIFFDLVARYFKHLGYDIKFVQNFTDVDDKIIDKANSENIDPLILSKKYIDEFLKDISKLNLIDGIIRPKVSDNITEILCMIDELIKSNYAYQVNGDVYFSVKSFKGYGELSKQNISSLEIGKRIEESDKKRDPLDFALWKSKKEGEIFWDSKFGKGRPGWHIECSALIKKYLGDIIDIHGGGQDLIFPHHENENAQSKCACKKEKLANYWMHNAFVDINNEKMSKSIGNIIYLRDLLEKYNGDIVRLLILNTHYRKPINFSEEDNEAVVKMYNNLRENLEFLNSKRNNLEQLDEKDILELSKMENEFHNAMQNDFNTALSFSLIIQRVKYLKKLLIQNDKLDVSKYLTELEYEIKEIFGLKLEKMEEKNMEIKPLIDLLIEIRENARKNKDYQLSDKIRDVLKEYNIQIIDKK